MSYIVQIIAAIYFSSFLFIIIPLLGLISGAVAGWRMRGVSVALGVIVGVVSGLLVILTFFLCGWVTGDLLMGMSDSVTWVFALSPPVVAVVVPPILLRVIRRFKGQGEWWSENRP